MQYLKKTKMYKLTQLLLEVHNYDWLFLPILKFCSYKFYRGSEWFTCYVDDYTVKLYVCSSYCRITIVKTIVTEDEDIDLVSLEKLYFWNEVNDLLILKNVKGD